MAEPNIYEQLAEYIRTESRGFTEQQITSMTKAIVAAIQGASKTEQFSLWCQVLLKYPIRDIVDYVQDDLEQYGSIYDLLTDGDNFIRILDKGMEAYKKDSYRGLLQGTILNDMKSVGKNSQPVMMFDWGVIEFLTNDQGKQVPLDTSSLKLCDMFAEKLAVKLPRDPNRIMLSDLEKYTRQEITITEYMQLTKLKNKKEARRQIKESLERLYNANIRAKKTISVGKKKQQIEVNERFVSNTEAGRGVYAVTFTPKMLKMIGTMAYMKRHKNMYQINGQYNPNSYYFGNKLHTHYHMNRGKTNAGIITVKALLDGAPAIPTYKEVSAKAQQFKKRIIIPFERDMTKLVDLGILSSWSYDRQISDIHDFMNAKVIFEFIAYPESEKKDPQKGGIR